VGCVALPTVLFKRLLQMLSEQNAIGAPFDAGCNTRVPREQLTRWRPQERKILASPNHEQHFAARGAEASSRCSRYCQSASWPFVAAQVGSSRAPLHVPLSSAAL
jgi:hypothetical protein